MTNVQERRESVVETPKQGNGPGRSRTFRVLAIMLVAIVTIGIGWLAIRDSGDETPAQTQEAVVSTTVADEALTTTEVTIPTGRFENRDTGLRILVLREDGTYSFNNQGFAVNGMYEVDDDLLTFLTEDIDREADSGTYHWSYEDGILKFNVIEDAHRSRYAFITYPFVLTE